LLTPSLLKATMKTQQMYTYEKNPDGSFDLKFKDGNVTTMKEYMYSPQQVDDIRTRLAILDSIVLSDDPYARRSEFKKEALALANRYGITAIQGKNLSLQFASDGWGNKIKG